MAELRREYGVEFHGVRDLLCRLAALGPATVGELVEATGTPYRRVLDIVHRLGVDVAAGRVGLGEAEAAEVQRILGCDQPGPGQEPDAEILNLLEGVAAGLPPSLWSLDHVPATTLTMWHRARYLASHYQMPGSHLVLLGDHDLTSVSTKLLVPEADVTVADIDERLLEYLDAVSGRLGLGLHLVSADLRLGLPRSLRGSADLVFSDPPYSTDGVELFVRRGLEALAERPGGRVLFCYGTNDRASEKQLAIQDMLVRLHLVLEELHPGFNRYRGAHAIGAASSLWVCRPTRLTRPATDAAEARIYSRGRASRESAPETIPPAVLAAVRAAASEAPGSLGLVGEGWAELAAPGAPGGGPGAATISLRELLDAATELPHAGRRRHWADVLAVNLDRFYGASLPRALMAAPAQSRVLVVAGARGLSSVASGSLRRLIEARFALAVIRQPQGDSPGVLSAVPAAVTGGQGASRPVGNAADWVLGYLQDHQAAKLRNAWREALCDLAARQGRSCTKNEARAAVEAAGIRPWELDCHLLELPLHRLAALVDAVVVSTAPQVPARPEVPTQPEVHPEG
jgi:predicted methyltransferase